MNKGDFIEAVAKKGDFETKADAARAYDTVMSVLTGRLTKGTKKDRVVRLPELGTFQVKRRKARKGRNPQTGESIKIPATNVVFFRAGKNLKDNV